MSRMRARFPRAVAAAALVRRDLAGSRRGLATPVARGLVAALVGLFAWFALSEFNVSRSASFGEGGLGFVAMLTLGAVALLAVPPLAADSLRRERESGLLDLLFLAGLDARTLALGRALSTFVLLFGLATAALPGLALLWFFRRTSPAELLGCLVVHAAWCWLLAGLVVALSARVRSAGQAYAAGLLLVLLFAWLGWHALQPHESGWLAVTSLMERASMRSYLPPSWANDALLLSGLAVHVLAGTWLSLGAGRALARRASAPRRDDFAAAVLRPGPRASSRWPLTWLHRRLHAAARPRAQALSLLALLLSLMTGLGALSLVIPKRISRIDSLWTVLGLTGAILVAVGFIGAALAGAWSAAALRERGEWTAMLTTPLGARWLLADLIWFSTSVSVVPVGTGLAFLLASLAAQGAEVALVGGVAASLAATFWACVVAAVAASLGARSSSSAAMIALGWPCALAIPTLLLRWTTPPLAESFEAGRVVAPTLLLTGALINGVLAATTKRPHLALLGLVACLAFIAPLLLDAAGATRARATESVLGGFTGWSTAMAAVLSPGRIMDPRTAWLSVPAPLALALLLTLVLLARAERMVGRAA